MIPVILVILRISTDRFEVIGRVVQEADQSPSSSARSRGSRVHYGHQADEEQSGPLKKGEKRHDPTSIFLG